MDDNTSSYSSFDPTRRRKSRFDVETKDISNNNYDLTNYNINVNVNVNLIELLGISPSAIGAIADDSVEGGYFIPATDPAFTKRIQTALIKNYEYIISKDLYPINNQNKSIYETTNRSSMINKFDKAFKSNTKLVTVANGQSITKNGVGIAQQANMKALETNSVYISGLPDDITEDEIDAIFSVTGKIKKIKLYVNSSTGKKKGDGLVTFTAPEFVKSAVLQFNNLDIGDGFILKVSRADFNNSSKDNTIDETLNSMKSIANNYMEYISEYNDIIPLTTPSPRASYRQIANNLPKECQIDKYPVVLLQNVYDPIILSDKSTSIQEFVLELEAEFLVECCQFGSIIRLIAPHNDSISHIDGLLGSIAITFADIESANRCISSLHQRYFDNRLVNAVVLTSEDIDTNVKPIIDEKNPTTGNAVDSSIDNHINLINNEINNDTGDDVDVDDFLNSLL